MMRNGPKLAAAQNEFSIMACCPYCNTLLSWYSVSIQNNLSDICSSGITKAAPSLRICIYPSDLLWRTSAISLAHYADLRRPQDPVMQHVASLTQEGLSASGAHSHRT